MLLTKDNIVTIVDSVVYYKIGVSRKALYSIANIRQGVSYIAFAVLFIIIYY